MVNWEDLYDLAAYSGAYRRSLGLKWEGGDSIIVPFTPSIKQRLNYFQPRSVHLIFRLPTGNAWNIYIPQKSL